MLWIVLLIAGLLETAWAIGLTYTRGFTQLIPSVLTLIAMAASMYLLALCVRPGALPIGTAYAVWTGIGAVGTAILGIILKGESAALPRVLFIGLIVIGIIGLKWVSSSKA